jgi:hypothetical protein
VKTALEADTPNPQRFIWLKRLCLLALLLVVSLGVLWLVWSAGMQSRIDRVVVDIRSAGEPIQFDDFVIAPAADRDNGAWYLAEARLRWPSIPGQPGVTIYDTDWYLEGEDAGFTDPVTDNAAYLASCDEVFDLLMRSRRVERSVYHTALSRPLLNMVFARLGDNRRLARLVDDAARRALDIGDIETAFETMLLQQAIARHTLGEPTVLIDSLVAISITAMNREFIEYALPQIESADLREGPARTYAERVIADLTSDTMHEGLIRAYIGERAYAYDYLECLIDGTDTAANLLWNDSWVTTMIDTPGLDRLYRPALQNEQRMIVQTNTEIIDALRDRASLDLFEGHAIAFEKRINERPWRYPVCHNFYPAYHAAVRTHYRNEAMMRCAAVAIAIKLYQADHDGKRPDALDELVPNYLREIPADPFSTTGGRIRYNPDGVIARVDPDIFAIEEHVERLRRLALGPYPVVYSVGYDGVDSQGGPLRFDEYGELIDERWQLENNGDLWFLLDPRPEPRFTDEDLGVEDGAFEDPFAF